MDSDDENLIIPPEHLNLSDEPLPELQLGPAGEDPDLAGAAAGDGAADTGPGPGEDAGDGGGEAVKVAAAMFDSEWDTFQMSIAR